MEGPVEAAIRTPTSQSGFQAYHCTANAIAASSQLQLTFTRTAGHSECWSFVLPATRRTYVAEDRGCGTLVVLEYSGTVISIRPTTNTESIAQWHSALASDHADAMHADHASQCGTVLEKRSFASSSDDCEEEEVCARTPSNSTKYRHSSLDAGLHLKSTSALSLLTPPVYLRHASSENKVFEESEVEYDDVFADFSAEPWLAEYV